MKNETALHELLDLADHSKVNSSILRKILSQLTTISKNLDIPEKQLVALQMRIACRELLISKTEIFRKSYKDETSIAEHTEKIRVIIIEMINLCD